MPRRGADHREEAAVGNVPTKVNSVRDVWEGPSTMDDSEADEMRVVLTA